LGDPMTGERRQIGDGFDDVRFALAVHANECRNAWRKLQVSLRVGAEIRQAQRLNPHGQPVSRTGISR